MNVTWDGLERAIAVAVVIGAAVAIEHIHFMISRDGYATLITQVFDNADDAIESDVVFGVTPALAGRFERGTDGVLRLVYDFVLRSGARRIPTPPIP